MVDSDTDVFLNCHIIDDIGEVYLNVHQAKLQKAIMKYVSIAF
jgi:hypothetical protein